MIVHTAEFETPVGLMRAASTERGLAYLSLPRQSGRGFEGWLRRHAPDACCEEAWKPNRMPFFSASETNPNGRHPPKERSAVLLRGAPGIS